MADYVGWTGEGGEAKTKATGTLTWKEGGWSTGWTTTYFGSYREVGAPGDPTGSTNALYVTALNGTSIPSQVYHNIFLGYGFGKHPKSDASGNFPSKVWRALIANLDIQVGINDLFNTAPAFDPFLPYYSSNYGDLRQREYWLSVRKAF